VLRAVRFDGSTLKFASQRLQQDREVMLAAVKTYGAALKYGGEDLQMDVGVVLEAVTQDGSALRFASSRIREATCPKRHPLTLFNSPWDGWYCSECAPTLRPDERIAKFVKGTKLHGCRQCG
jgi:hypothetical protein